MSLAKPGRNEQYANYLIGIGIGGIIGSQIVTAGNAQTIFVGVCGLIVLIGLIVYFSSTSKKGK